MASPNLSNEEDDFELDLDAQSPPGSPDPSSAPRTSRYEDEETREAALKRELESVRNVNKVIEGVVESLEKARNNMDTVNRTVNSASTLLQTWTRILSQTEHNQRLILAPHWNGATQDLADIDNEEVERHRAAERRVIEDQARREAAARRAEDDARKREAAAAAPGKRRGSVRGRTGSLHRPASSASGSGSAGRGRGNSTRGTGSGIGRGLRGSRRT